MTINEKIKSIIEIGGKTALGFLPDPVSNFVTALYDDVKSNLLNKRLEQWKIEFTSRLSKLENQYETLTNNESFATTLIKATELAIRTESDEKRKLLATALVNSYLQNIEEDKIIIFLHLIEKYTTMHIRVLRYIHDERMYEHYPFNVRPTFYQEFLLNFHESDNSYLKKVINDLQNDSLIEQFNIDTKQYIFNKKLEVITQLGNDFYDFIKGQDDCGHIKESN